MVSLVGHACFVYITVNLAVSAHFTEDMHVTARDVNVISKAPNPIVTFGVTSDISSGNWHV